MTLARFARFEHKPGCPLYSGHAADVTGKGTKRRSRGARLVTNIRYIATADDVVPPPQKVILPPVLPRPKAVLPPVAPPTPHKPVAVARTTDTVPPPPSLKAAILARRKRETR